MRWRLTAAVCGNSISGEGESVEDGCDMPCNGNRTQELCGGSNRLNVYELDLTDDDEDEDASTSMSSVGTR